MSKIRLTTKELRTFYTITKMKNRLKTMEEHNRGLKKRLKAMQKASENNHNGMIYWKATATSAIGALDTLMDTGVN